MKTKQQTRKEMRSTLKSLPSSQIASFSVRICQHLSHSSALFQKAASVAVFSALPLEIDLSSLLISAPSKCFLYPLCQSNGLMTFHRVSILRELKPGMLGILEPDPDLHEYVPIEDIDLFICPGLAFSRNGARLGYGGGYYDRALTRKKDLAKSIGVTTEQQVLNSFASEPHDISMDFLVTEKGVYPSAKPY